MQHSLKIDLDTLDALTDAEADNTRTAIRQGDLPEDCWPITWATVRDSVDQMPDDVLAHYGNPEALTEALTRVIALVGTEADVVATYALPDYDAFDHTEDEVRLLAKHDLGEDLHAFVGAPEDDDSPDVPGACTECGDTEEGLMHNNSWRSVEPLMDEDDDVEEGGNPVPSIAYEASTPAEKAADALAVLPLPVVAVSEDAGLDGLGTVLGNLTGLAFDLTTLDGEVSGELVAVSYLAAMGDYRLTLKDVDTEQTASVLLSGVTKIVYS